MKPLCLAPGPTKIHDELPQWLDDAAAEGVFWRSHRSSWFQGLYQRVDKGLRELLEIPGSHRIAFLTSANEAWWRTAETCSGRAVTAYVGGEFGRRWAQSFQRSGAELVQIPYGPDWVGALPTPTVGSSVALVMNETSTGFALDAPEIRRLAEGAERVFLDVVSAVPLATVPWELADAAFWSVQKGFCLPAGLAVGVLGPRVEGPTGTSFHSLATLWADAGKWQTTETPNVLGIYLLSRVIETYLALGIDELRRQTTARAEELYRGLEQTPFRPLVFDPSNRSRTVVAIRADFEVEPLRKHLIDEHGVYLGACYDEFKPNCLRIANFPSHTADDHARVLELLGSESVVSVFR